MKTLKTCFILLGACLLFDQVQCQHTLREMIDQANGGQRQFQPQNPPSSPQWGANVQAGGQFRTSADQRFDARASAVVSKSILKLAHDISEKIFQQQPNVKSQVTSPMSIAATLSLVLLGAKGNTYNELLHALGLDADQMLMVSPYKIHEEFGLILEDITSDIKSLDRVRPQVPWRTKPYMFHSRGGIGMSNRFSFPSDDQPQQPSYEAPSMRQSRGEGRDEYYRSENYLNAPENTEHKIYIANGIFVQDGYSFRPNYKTVVETVYKSELKVVDYQNNGQAAAREINDWVRQNTNGKIQSIVDQTPPADTRIILANALYFKAQWEKNFIDGATQSKEFYPDGLGGRSIQVEMMAHGGTFPFYESVEYDCRILGLPYKQNTTTMYIILPNNSNGAKLRQLQGLLTADKIEELINRMELKTTILLFPKMHMTFSTDLSAVLQALGVRSLFMPSRSDLSLISTGYEVPHNDQPAQMTDRFVPSPVYMASSVPATQPAVSQYAYEEEKPFIFSRVSTDDDKKTIRKRRDVTYKAESSFRGESEPLRMKDFVLNKRITKPVSSKKLHRSRRDDIDTTQAIKALEALRLQPSNNPGLYASQVLHKVDLTINEHGTEGGAATSVIITKSGTDVVFRTETPFMFLIRHDDTKAPLFYGSVFEPENNP